MVVARHARALRDTPIPIYPSLRPDHRIGGWIHDLYPLVMLLPFYREIGVLNFQQGRAVTLANDVIVQEWEAALFGGQISYDWIRRYPSAFWSGVFHSSYFAYYLIIITGPSFSWSTAGAEKRRGSCSA